MAGPNLAALARIETAILRAEVDPYVRIRQFLFVPERNPLPAHPNRKRSGGCPDSRRGAGPVRRPGGRHRPSDGWPCWTPASPSRCPACNSTATAAQACRRSCGRPWRSRQVQRAGHRRRRRGHEQGRVLHHKHALGGAPRTKRFTTGWPAAASPPVARTIPFRGACWKATRTYAACRSAATTNQVALRSHQRAVAAQRNGAFDAELVSVTVHGRWTRAVRASPLHPPPRPRRPRAWDRV